MTESARARVWVVDDDRAVRFVLAEALRDAGYRVQAFVQGVVASPAFRMSRIDAPETTTTAPAAARH